MSKIRILIDTNVIIALEDDEILKENYATFYRESTKIGTVLVHQISKNDINKDKKEERKRKTLSKLKKYQVLSQPPIPDPDFINQLNVKDKPNELIDVILLFAVFKNAVDFLVTEDIGIHKKAFKLGIQERVFTVKQAVDFFNRLIYREIPSHTLLKHMPVHNLNLQDSFFDSLRSDYGEDDFNSWFKNISREGRQCWAYIEDNAILAICIYKEEQKPDSRLIPVPTLKLCTFKVSDNVKGKKIGELMLKLAFQYTALNNLKSVYLTTFPKYQELILFLKDFGFSPIDSKNMEDIFLKKMVIDRDKMIDPISFVIKYYPSYLGDNNIQKFIVPIQPQFHNRLFPECTGTQKRIDDFTTPNPEGNTIKKAYICNAKTRQIKPGDILLFYRSKDVRSITSIGVVERTIHSDQASIIAAAVSNRTVYNYEEIEQLSSRTALAIIFRHVGNLNRPVNAFTLQNICDVKGYIQSIRKISYNTYNKIIEAGK